MPVTSKGILRYIGSKWRLSKKLIPLFPKHKIYVEPFCGSLAMLLSKHHPSKIEVVNDANSELINFYEILRTHKSEFLEMLFFTPYSRELFKTINSSAYKARLKTPVERAWVFYACNRMGWNCGITDKDSIVLDKHGNYALQFRNIIEMIVPFVERINGVYLECGSFSNVIKAYDQEDAFFYCDPPYTVGADLYEMGDFSKEHHEELAFVLSTIKGKAMVSYYDDPWLDSLYSSWNKECFTLLSRQKREEKTEVVYANYTPVVSEQLTIGVGGYML